MKINPSYNPEENKFVVEITTDLLKDFFFNFRGMLLENTTVPKDIEVVRKSAKTAVVTFTVKKEEVESVGKSIPSSMLSEMGKLLGIPSENIGGGRVFSSDEIKPFETVKGVIEDFVNKASIYKFRKTEFIPLTKYPIEDLKNDCIAAIKAKRDYCIVDDFEKYSKAMDDRTYKIRHFNIPYGTTEYVDVFLCIVSGNIDKLIDKYMPLLEDSKWIEI